MKKETLAVHGGEQDNSFYGAINTPIFQSSTYTLDKGQDYHSIKYMRLSNSPNHNQVHTKLAQLEGAEAALVTASGMAAIATTLLTHLKAGEHLLAQNTLYGGTHDLLREDLVSAGIQSTLVDINAPDTWGQHLTPLTKVFYVEAMSNPLVRIGDLKRVVEFCETHNLISVIDNTFPTPVFFRPIEMGFDLVVHSATKALNGHSDIIAGAIAGSKKLVAPIVKKLNHLGGFLDTNTVFLLNRGLKTLFVRVQRQSENAQRIAEYLAQHSKIKAVNFPGLESHDSHQRAKQWFSGFGTMLSFELKGDVEQADRFISKLKLFLEAPSLGGVESLVTRPATSSHSGMSIDERRRAGIEESLIRISVGIENSEDLIADLEQALSVL